MERKLSVRTFWLIPSRNGRWQGSDSCLYQIQRNDSFVRKGLRSNRKRTEKMDGYHFCIDKAEVEYFNLGVNPIFRETYILGNVSIKEKGYYITESCIRCGTCMKHCPQKCIEKGTPFAIRQEHCLHCGNCYENCPVKAVVRK